MWIEQIQKNKYILAYLKLWAERRTGIIISPERRSGPAFRAVPAYFHLCEIEKTFIFVWNRSGGQASKSFYW